MSACKYVRTCHGFDIMRDVYAILGGNVYDLMLHINAATLRGLTSFILFLYNVVSENHSVQIPPGGEGGL